jgi:DNA-binding CsgD family transcriptional regulator
MPDKELASEVINYCDVADDIDTAAGVLNGLHAAVSKAACVSVLGAVRLPLRPNDWDAIIPGKTLFLHEKAPKDYWRDYRELAPSMPDPGIMMARLSLAPYTWTESMRMLEPVAADRWAYELKLKHGMRDGLTCPIGSRWVVAYWSRNVLTDTLTDKTRALLFLGANFAAIQLERLSPPDARRLGSSASLTPRELAVLRQLSLGKRTREIAEHLSLGEETVRSHLKKAQAKLGVNDRTHAVAEAIRRRLLA